MNIRDLLRAEPNKEVVKEKLQTAFSNRPKDGFEAEALRSAEVSESMTTIGG